MDGAAEPLPGVAGAPAFDGLVSPDLDQPVVATAGGQFTPAGTLLTTERYAMKKISRLLFAAAAALVWLWAQSGASVTFTENCSVA